MLKATNIYKSYGQLQVLKGVGIELEPGEVVALVGSSGAGKSTLLQILGTLDTADAGEVMFDDKNILTFGERQQAQFRNQSLGFVFQFHHLLPEFTAVENVCMPALIGKQSMRDIQPRAEELLTALGLKDRFGHKPGELSGGEQQRVSVARALINKPRLILADEPTGNLDTHNSEELYRLIFDLAATTGVSFLIATHNLDLAGKADRTIRIQDGLIVS
ncbi:MAG: ABC transporter ATP-binding protein [Bacteroidia bacterium]|nr:ABC transporter ATP-binding protein [Bacteroidia bacterium]